MDAGDPVLRECRRQGERGGRRVLLPPGARLGPALQAGTGLGGGTTGGPEVKDISGSDLPGISRWALSLGGEYAKRSTLLGRAGQFFGAVDGCYRSSFLSSASASRYLVVDGYPLLNARVGFKWTDGWTLYLWSRNVLDREYFELLSAAPGNSGLYVGQPGDPRTFGLTLRVTLQ